MLSSLRCGAKTRSGKPYRADKPYQQVKRVEAATSGEARPERVHGDRPTAPRGDRPAKPPFRPRPDAGAAPDGAANPTPKPKKKKKPKFLPE